MNNNDEYKNKHFFAKTLGSFGLTTVGFIGAAINPVMWPVCIYGCIKLAKNLEKDYIKNSMFSVQNNALAGKSNFIAMGVANPGQVISLVSQKQVLKNHFQERTDRESLINAFTMGTIMNQQMINLFCQLDRKDKNGERIQYTTTTHKVVYDSLLKLQKLGFVEGIPPKEEAEKGKEKSLASAKILLGNFENLYEKVQMYNISFNLTDKVMTSDDIKKFLKEKSEFYNIKQKNGKIKGIELKNLKLLN